MSKLPSPAENEATAVNNLRKRGFRVDEIRTESFERPNASSSASAPQSTPTQQSRPNTLKLPPGHPLGGQHVNAQKDVVQRDQETIGESQRAVLDQEIQDQTEAAEPEPESITSAYAGMKVTALPFSKFDPEAIPQSELDANYFSLELPSLSKFYPFRALSLRLVKGAHQAKFERARKESNVRYVVEAISATLGDRISAFDLTPADFYFVMFWQRVNSFPKNPKIVKYKCNNPDHVASTLLKVDHPDYKAPETLDMEVFVDKTTVDTDFADDMDLSQFADLIAKYDLHVETMRDLVEYTEIEEQIELSKKSEADKRIDIDRLEWAGGRAAFFRRKEGRNTLLERMALLDDMDGDDLFELEEYIDAVTAYGVKEFANLKCKECGAHHRVSISIDALNFLPDRR